MFPVNPDLPVSGPVTSLPAVFGPMLPTLVREPFDSPDHLFEVKWDGVRVLAFCDRSSTRLFSRTGRDVSAQYPEFADLHTRWPGENAVVDGEIVAMDAHGRPSFELLQRRINLARPADVAQGARRTPLQLVLFDLVFANGRWLGSLPLSDRTARLAEEVRFGESVQRSEPVAQHGRALFEAARSQGLEGVVAKKRNSHYLPGKRTREWLKIKTVHEVDCVVGGYSAGNNSRAGSLGALQVGAYDSAGRLQYLGAVGTGFRDADLARLKEILQTIGSPTCPFSGFAARYGAAQVHWVRPELVCVVEYRELTSGGRLRAPSFKGLRRDKLPQDCLLPA